MPGQYIGRTLDARADSELVKLFYRGQVVKIHPRQPAGGRWTDPNDLPEERASYAMRDLDRRKATAAGHGGNIGTYSHRLLEDPLPWTRMRAVYRLLGLVERYGPGPVDTACGTALDLDAVSVSKINAMLVKAVENTTPMLPAAAGHPAGRFARQPDESAAPPLIGYCSRNLVADACSYANICEQCDNFSTGVEFIPALQSQLADVTELRQDAEDRGWNTEVARHARVITSITRHLDQLAHDNPPSPPT